MPSKLVFALIAVGVLPPAMADVAARNHTRLETVTLSRTEIEEHANHMLHHGYVMIENHVPDDAIDACVQKVEAAMPNRKFRIEGLVNGSIRPFAPYADARDTLPQGWRLTNVESQLACIRHIVLSANTQAILGEYLKAAPTLLQTLYYEYGSGQQTHSDFPNVSPPWISGYNANTLVGSTVYFEESRDDNAALYYYPQSHLNTRVRALDWQKFPGEDRDSKNVAMHKYIQETVDRHHSRKLALAQKGTLILWTANLIHGGLPLANRLASRKSIIAHYGEIPNGAKGIGLPYGQGHDRVLQTHGGSAYFRQVRKK